MQLLEESSMIEIISNKVVSSQTTDQDRVIKLMVHSLMGTKVVFKEGIILMGAKEGVCSFVNIVR